jgi:O-antigen/teichoic acid export membrane protein
MFGPDFVIGYQAMIILCIGQMINAGSGSVGFMLIMTGRPLANTFNSWISCLINVLLNFFLIPRYGIIGAAVAVALSISLLQLLRLLQVWIFLKLHPFRMDFIKPIISTFASVIILALFHYAAMNEISIAMLPFLFIFYLITYSGFLWLMRLSPEDHIVLNGVKTTLIRSKR